MKRLNTITLVGFAVCGFLLGMKALDLVEAGITLLLMVWGGYAYGARASAYDIMADDMREILEDADDIN